MTELEGTVVLDHHPFTCVCAAAPSGRTRVQMHQTAHAPFLTASIMRQQYPTAPLDSQPGNVLSETIPTHEYESKVLTRAFEEITGIKMNHHLLGEGEVVTACPSTSGGFAWSRGPAIRSVRRFHAAAWPLGQPRSTPSASGMSGCANYAPPGVASYDFYQEGLGRRFGAGLYAAEVEHLVEHEWTRTPEDILWRRAKKGLRMPESGVQRLREFLEVADMSIDASCRPGPSAPGRA